MTGPEAALGRELQAFPVEASAGTTLTHRIWDWNARRFDPIRQRVRVHEHGVVWVAERTDTIRWHEVATFVRESRITRRNSADHTMLRYGLGLHDGREFMIVGHGLRRRGVRIGTGSVVRYTGLEGLADLLDPRITAAQLPGAQQALDQGRSVSCGALTVDGYGIHRGNKVLIWPDLESIEFGQGTVVVRKRGKRFSWTTVEVPDLANLTLFLTIARVLGEPHGSKVP